MPKRRAKPEESSDDEACHAKRTSLLETFHGNHARVLIYYMELGNFTLQLDTEKDELLVKPRNTKRRRARRAPPRRSVFDSRFGVHFRALGFENLCTVTTHEPKYAFVYRSFSKAPLDLDTLKPPRATVTEKDLLDVDLFAL
tara:strand:- start:992 stop:1417 length:426 start_codon:yes stop_codon:yes gene_type:complete